MGVTPPASSSTTTSWTPNLSSAPPSSSSWPSFPQGLVSNATSATATRTPSAVTPSSSRATDQPKTREFIQECPNDGKEYFCRKIYQNVRGDERVIRSCGWEKNEKSDCYATVLEEYNTYVCQCNTDECNSASLSSLAVFSTLLMAYLMQ